MKIILCAMILSLVSVSNAVTTGNVVETDLKYVCKSSMAPGYSYVANVNTAVLKLFYSTPDLADGLPTEIADVPGLEVVKSVEDINTKKGKKFHTTYRFYKMPDSENGMKEKFPIFEIEMERDSNSKYVAYADAKVMNVKPNDTNDIDENITCKRNIKF